MEGYWLLLSWVVTSLVYQPCLGAPRAAPICDISCCAVEPSCAEANRVTCDCPQMDTMSLRAGDVPDSVQELRILKAGEVIIHSDAISSLSHLTNLSLHGVRNVSIKQGGMALKKDYKLALVRMEDIETVHIQRQAASGHWEEKVGMELVRIGTLHIETEAFKHVSETLGPRLMLQDIDMLALESRAFSAPVAHMALDSVHLEVCHAQSFGGQVHTTTFNNVTIAEASAECVVGFKKQATLFIRSSRIDVLRPGAFSGELRKLSINSSDFLMMHAKCLNLQLVELNVGRLFVQQLHSNGLSVRADEKIQLDEIRVVSLREKAFAGMLIEPTPTGFCRPMVINKMDIDEIEVGSLAFSECADLLMSDLRVHLPSPSLCPTENLTRVLSAGADSGPLSPTQDAVFWQLYEDGLCDEMDDSRPFPVVAKRQVCEPGHIPSEPSEKTAARAPSREDAFLSHGRGSHPLVSFRHGGDSSTANPPDAAVVEASQHDVEDRHHNDEPVFAYLIDNKAAEEMNIPGREARKATDRTDKPLPTERDPESTVVPSVVAVGGHPAPGPVSDAPDRHHQLMLYLTLGVVLSLTAVLAAALLVLLVRRHRRRRHADQTPAVHEALVVIANRLLRQDVNDGAAGMEKSRPAAPSDQGRPSVDGQQHQYSQEHQYETIRPELMLQPPPSQQPLIRFDSYDGSMESFIYNRLMER